jgi:hypothetical protein
VTDSFDDLRDLYQEVILDHGRRPRHARRLDSFDATAKGPTRPKVHRSLLYPCASAPAFSAAIRRF